MRGRHSWVLLALLLCFGATLRGQALPFFTNTAQTVGFESNALRTFSQVVARSRLEVDGREVLDPEGRRVLVFAQVFAVPIRIDPNTVLTVSVPVLHKELSFKASTSQAALTASGLGDATFLLKRRVYQNDFLGGGVQAALLAGVKLPTGDHDQEDARGDLLPRGLQLGSGSVDIPVGFVMTLFKGRIGFTSDILHRFNNSSEGFRPGDETQVNLALGYRLVPKKYGSFRDTVVNTYLELNAAFSEPASLHGREVIDSGGRVVFLTPGLQAVLSPRFLLEAAFQIPAWQELNGAQLAFAPTASFGLRMLF